MSSNMQQCHLDVRQLALHRLCAGPGSGMLSSVSVLPHICMTVQAYLLVYRGRTCKFLLQLKMQTYLMTL